MNYIGGQCIWCMEGFEEGEKTEGGVSVITVDGDAIRETGARKPKWIKSRETRGVKREGECRTSTSDSPRSIGETHWCIH